MIKVNDIVKFSHGKNVLRGEVLSISNNKARLKVTNKLRTQSCEIERDISSLQVTAINVEFKEIPSIKE